MNRLKLEIANEKKGAMKTSIISKHKQSTKNQTSGWIFLITMAIFVLFENCCYGQTVIQQQQQNVVVNPVVIEKPVYIERYRTVYVDKPQPKRIARKLSAPVQLLGYLWVHTEDLGDFKSQPHSVIANVNAQSPYGRNNWRIPTPDELAVMEKNADKIGLGDDIYMATNSSNGVLRLVSTGKSVAEKEQEVPSWAQGRWQYTDNQIIQITSEQISMSWASDKWDVSKIETDRIWFGDYIIIDKTIQNQVYLILYTTVDGEYDWVYYPLEK